MNQFWTRLLACERRCQRFLNIIRAQKRQIKMLQQQLRDLSGNTS